MKNLEVKICTNPAWIDVFSRTFSECFYQQRERYFKQKLTPSRPSSPLKTLHIPLKTEQTPEQNCTTVTENMAKMLEKKITKP